jgi:hypothetical protein
MTRLDEQVREDPVRMPARRCDRCRRRDGAYARLRFEQEPEEVLLFNGGELPEPFEHPPLISVAAALQDRVALWRRCKASDAPVGGIGGYADEPLALECVRKLSDVLMRRAKRSNVAPRSSISAVWSPGGSLRHAGAKRALFVLVSAMGPCARRG